MSKVPVIVGVGEFSYSVGVTLTEGDGMRLVHWVAALARVAGGGWGVVDWDFFSGPRGIGWITGARGVLVGGRDMDVSRWEKRLHAELAWEWNIAHGSVELFEFSVSVSPGRGSAETLELFTPLL